jgi:hypothetical protein
MEEIQNAKFILIQADETPAISCISQFVTLLRYIKRYVRLEDLILCLTSKPHGRRFGACFKTRTGTLQTWTKVNFSVK